jgi:lipoprotein signal peptidase
MPRKLARFHYVALTACIALAIDQVTKSLAVRYLSAKHITYFGPIRLRLRYDLGNTVHPHPASFVYILETRLLVAALLVGIFFVLKSRVAAVGLGLLFGALFGNFLSLAFPPHKVADFLLLGTAFNRVWTADFSDFCAFFGMVILGLCISMKFIYLIRSIETKRHRAGKEVAPHEPLVPVGVETSGLG